MAKQAHNLDQLNSATFEQTYPLITEWVTTQGWIEIGQIEGMSPFIVALDEGGVIWEGKKKYKTLDEAFQALEKGLAEWLGVSDK
jgi:hypothetical protein